MRMIRTLLFCAVTFQLSCGGRKDAAIAGTYVRPFSNEIAKGSDTLIVTNYQGNTCRMECHMAARRLEHGRYQPQVIQKEHWIATYNADKKVLQETAFGRQLYWNPDKQTLLQVDHEYKKIK